MSSILPEQPGVQPVPGDQPASPPADAGQPDMEAIQAQLDALAQQMKQEQDAKAAQQQQGGGLLGSGTGFLGSNIHSPNDLWAVQAIKGAGEGAWKGIFETSDFLFGEPDPADRSWFRSGMEGMAGEDAQNSTVNGLSQSIGQFAIGMLGAGKLIKAAEAVPKVGAAISAAGSAVKALRGGAFGLESAKAAAAGAVAFDPHDQRLSNIIQSFPELQNPISQFLAADPKDSATLGRVKTALESLGMDYALHGLMIGLKALKGIRSKDFTLLDEAEREAFTPPASEATSGELGGEHAGTSIGSDGPAAMDSAPPASRPAISGGSGHLANPSVHHEGGLGGVVAGDGAAAALDLPPGGAALGDGEPTGAGGGANRTPPLDGGEGGGSLHGPNHPRIDAFAAPDHSDVVDGGGLSGGLGVAPGDAGGPEAADVLRGSRVASDTGHLALDLHASNENGAGPNSTSTLPGVKIGEAPGLSAANEAEPPRIEVVQSVTDAKARDAGTVLEPKFKTVGVSEPELQAIEKGLYEDGQSLLEHDNNWLDAVYDGHPFANSAKIPYQKLGTPDAVGNLITDLTDVAKPKLDKGKGGAVMSDRSVAMQTAAMVRMFNENPAEMMALFEMRGADAQRMTATMNTAYRVAARAFSDAYKTLMHIQAGSLLDGMNVAQMREFAVQQLDVATTALNHANSIKANAARSLRQLRPEFAITAKQLASVRGMDQDLLRDMILGTGGDISKMAEVIQKPGWMRSITDWAQYLVVNNLLWGWKTHLVNMVGNVGMAALRPTERAIGSFFLGTGGTASVKAYREYKAMGGAILDGWRGFKDTLFSGDSVLVPHNTDRLQQGAPRSVDAFLQSAPYRPVKGLADLLYNARVAGLARLGVFAMGFPTRALGAVDEAVKTTVYKSHVAGLAWEEGAKQGLSGAPLDQYIKGRLAGSVDEFGRATDVVAKLEAQTSTFSQDLLPGTLGKGVQSFVSMFPPAKLVLPFVKTPTNVLRMGIKYSPILNLAQTEYRQMIRGELGADRQAQAFGQMVVGSLLMTTAAYLVSSGRFTGGGPANKQLKAELVAKGWQPYSIITKNADGTNSYFPLGRFDPYGLPFGIIADLQDYAEHNGSDNPGVSEAIAALSVAIMKNITNRTYLRGISDFIDFATDPDTKANQYLGQQAANFVPFASLLKQVNPDPYMREARIVSDKVLATLPGFSEHLQPTFDAFGDPKTVRKGLWSNDANDMVDRELLRLGLETGRGLTPPAAIIDGVDLRDFTLPDGRNAYTAYQQLAGYPPGQKSLKTRVREVMERGKYAQADESSDAPGTKIWMLQSVVQKYRENARHLILRDPAIRDAFLKARRAARDALAAKQDGAIPSNPGSQPQQLLQGLFGSGG
jgi:hypothetical protein